MAREAEKSGRETGKSKAETSTSTPSSTSTGSRSGSGASARSGSGEEGSSASESGKSGETGLTEFRSERHREMQETLAKRADDGADVTAIVREFTALWIPNHVVEVELLVPALEDVDVDRDKMTAVAIRKDMLNLLLADLIQSAADQGARAKLEALSDLLDAVIAASQPRRAMTFCGAGRKFFRAMNIVES